MKTTILRVTGSTVAVAGCMLFSGGVALAAEPTISTTGPDSVNIIKTENKCESTVNNDNNVDLTNNNPQKATSGDSSAKENTSVGSVSSGNASNSSQTNVVVNIRNESNNACASNVSEKNVSEKNVLEKNVTVSEKNVSKPVSSVSPTSSVPAPAAAPSTAALPVGGMGAEVTTPLTQQVAVPVGGVGAGSGGLTYFAALVSVTVASIAWFVVRLRKQLTTFLG